MSCGPPGPQTITVKDELGQDVPYTISENDLKNGKFVIYPVLTRQDATRLAKAKAIQEYLIAAPNFIPIFQQNGWVFDPGIMHREYCNLIEIDENNRSLRRISTFEQQLQQQNQMLQQQLMQAQQMLSMKPPPGGNGKAPPEKQSPGLQNGGPMGDEQSDLAYMTQMRQLPWELILK